MKILFYGVGSIGQKHIKNLKNIYGEKCSIISYKSKAYGDETNNFLSLNDVKVFFDEDEAYAENPEIVFVTNPTFLHYKTIKKAISQNCHIFVEKPICLKLSEIKSIEKITKGKNLVLFIGYCLRYNKIIKEFKNQIDNNVLGKIYNIEINFSSYLPKLHPWRDYRDIYRNKKENGGDIIFEFSHELDYLFWIFGKPFKINAQLGRLGNFESDTDDFFNGLVEMESNAILQISLSYLSAKPRRYCHIIGENGVAKLNLIENSVCFFDKGANKKSLYKPSNFDVNQMYINEIKDFMYCVKNKLPSPINLQESKNLLKFIDLSKKSNNQNRAIFWS